MVLPMQSMSSPDSTEINALGSKARVYVASQVGCNGVFLMGLEGFGLLVDPLTLSRSQLLLKVV